MGSDREMDCLAGLDSAGLQQLEQMYRSHAGWLRVLVTHRLRAQPTDVDDIVQDAWLRAAGCEVDNIQHPKAFLSQTALNLFRDRKRRDAVRQQHRESVTADQGGDRHGMSEQEAVLELERIVLDLPEKIRDVFVLSRFRHMSNAEIATTLGISIKTVEWRMGKALALCTSRLRD